MFRSPVLPEIRSLDPVRDHSRLTFLTCRVDFPWDMTRALELALFRTFCIPSISALLDKTQEFGCRAQRRYDDTDIIVSEIMEHSYDSERGLAAIRRMNQIHGRFAISNDDFLYVLSTFVFVPIRWLDRFGWRALLPAEKTAMFHFWREVGRRMNIKDLPESSEAFEAFSNAYEQRHYRFTETNQRVVVPVAAASRGAPRHSCAARRPAARSLWLPPAGPAPPHHAPRRAATARQGAAAASQKEKAITANGDDPSVPSVRLSPRENRPGTTRDWERRRVSLCLPSPYFNSPSR